jgi:hypothetical protein
VSAGGVRESRGCDGKALVACGEIGPLCRALGREGFGGFSADDHE